MARHWTQEERQRQSAAIRQWQPWEKSTGPGSPEGKAVSSQNVFVGNANRQAALVLARAELKAAQEKVTKLTRGKELTPLERELRKHFPSFIW